MAFPKGNDFWKLRKDFDSEAHKKLSIEQLFLKSQEYIDYVLNSPLTENDFRGKDANEVTLQKMRSMHEKGLCHHLGISTETLNNWMKDPQYFGVITQIKQLIYVYKFEGAAAGMLNANIIARK